MQHFGTNDESRHLMPADLFSDEASADSDELLNSLLEESTQSLAGTPPTQAAKAQDIFSLDELLAESMAVQAQREQMKGIRKAAANGFGTKEERDANNELLRKWEAAREWNKVANVAGFNRCLCLACDNYSVAFAGYYERQVHRSNASIERLVKVTTAHTDSFKKEVKYFDETSAVCEDCLELQGYPIEVLKIYVEKAGV